MKPKIYHDKQYPSLILEIETNINRQITIDDLKDSLHTINYFIKTAKRMHTNDVIFALVISKRTLEDMIRILEID